MSGNNQRRLFMLVILILLLALAGCSPAAVETPTPTIPNISVEETPILPSATPEVVEQPGVVILLAPANVDQTLLSTWQPLVQQAALQHGLTFEQRDSLTLDAIPQELKLVVSLPPVGDLQTLVDGLPEVQFVAVDEAGLNVQANVSLVASGSASVNSAFVAGYIAAVQSDEYRIGLIATNSTQGQSYGQAFENGVWYFCGACSQIYPPYVAYPIYEEVAPDAGLDQIRQAANNLQANQVQIVHLDPQLESEAALQMLAEAGFYIIGSQPPPSGLETNWVASVLTASTVAPSDVLESALNGQALGLISGKPKIGYTGASEARIGNFNEIIEMLETDAIDPVGNVN
ncbi:hypothetical protein KQH54_00950 [bacterium]|nr:hypothetical protein [bacterium]